MPFGLTDQDVARIRSAIAEQLEVDEALVFGSRAMGNHKRGSDIDLAVKGAQVELRTISALSARLNDELPLPYEFDVVDYASINTPALIEHIDTHGKTIYRRSIGS